MIAAALVCLRCGGPLAHATSLPAVLECGYCGAAMSVTVSGATITRESTPDELREAKRKEASKAFFDALSAMLADGRPPFTALREASAAHLGTAGTSETVARITIALARDFERDQGVSLLAEPRALARIAQAYLDIGKELVANGEAEINLPFVAAGPKHLTRRVTPALFAELALRDPGSPLPPPQEPPPVKKKKWWPF